MSNSEHIYLQEWLEQESTAHPKTSCVRIFDRPINDDEISLIHQSLKKKFATAIIADSPNKEEIISVQNQLNPIYWLNKRQQLGHSNLTTCNNLSSLKEQSHDYFTKLAAPPTVIDILQKEYNHMLRFTDIEEHKNTDMSYRFLTLHSKENCLREGRATNWHPDAFVTLSIYSHFTGAAVEWLPPDIDHEIYYDPEELDKNIQTLTPGQILIDSGGLTHRSSQHIPKQGQLSATMYYSPSNEIAT